MKKKKENSSKELFSNAGFVLRYLYKTNKRLFFVKGTLSAVQIAASFIPIIFVRLILNSLTDNKGVKSVLVYIFAMASAVLATDILGSILSYHNDKEITRTRYLANLRLGEAIMRFPYSEIEKPKVKNFVSLAGGDSLISIFNLVTSMLSSIVTVIGLIAIVVTIQPLILLLIAAVITSKMLIDKRRRKISTRWRNEWAQYGRESAYLYEVMRDIPLAKEVRVNNISKWLYNKIGEHTDKKTVPLLKKNNKDYSKLELATFLAGQIQDAVVYLILAFKVVFDGMSIGNFSMYMTSINNFAGSVGGIFKSISDLMQQSLFAKEFRYCIEKSAETNDGGASEARSKEKSVKIEFRNVSFMYPDTDRMILKNVSFALDAGETLSIVGENGAGKTTLVKLICRFYEPTEGEILVNGIPIQDYSEDEYYDIIGAVFQDFKLFSFSVAENVDLRVDHDDKRILDAIKRSGLEEKIKGLTCGTETYISKEFDEAGIEFSGGEGQKLAIARAVYKDSPLIILDEPTSALDPIAEYEIYRRFDNLIGGKSAIYISHRMSSTRFTDKIIVIDDGYLVETGNHDELMQIENGVYKRMFDMQAKYYV